MASSPGFCVQCRKEKEMEKQVDNFCFIICDSCARQNMQDSLNKLRGSLFPQQEELLRDYLEKRELLTSMTILMS